MKLLFKFAAIWYSRLYLLAFFVFAILALPGSKHLAGAVLQQIFIAFLIFFRLRQKKQLFMIPDEVLVCLPYFWALANLGSAQGWFVVWQYYFIAAFVMSSLALVGNRRWFTGGLRHNSLLQAIYCALVFILLFATILRSVFPPFTYDLYRETIMNSLVFFAGIPVCLISTEPGRQT
ncbi:MAG: hypothetical protein CVV42_05135 [Candidatus Riflebacteria bacterium HGW-Riflebacteria-2]|jgi:hypothetical protein|nr:MAG: hypothetical protein CVV42_05135 [Candidatus Riflebacteria bacterium HGW-Riflebacteria-2]